MRGLAAAVRFLTVLPLVGADEAAARRISYVWFPVAGAAIGAIGGLCVLAGRVLSPLAGGVAGVAGLAAVTGALHLDGLADCFDSMGGRSREQRLAIMRDSRLGTFGAAALCLLLLVKVAALARLEADEAVRALIASGALARLAPIALGLALPGAVGRGMGASFAGSVTGLGLGMAALMAVAVAVTAVGATAPAMLLAVVVSVAMVALWADRRLGGVTGDVMGASIELNEGALLCVAAAL